MLLPVSGDHGLLLQRRGRDSGQESEGPNAARGHQAGPAHHPGLLPLLVTLQHCLGPADCRRLEQRRLQKLQVHPPLTGSSGCDQEPGLLSLLPQPFPVRLCRRALPQRPASSALQVGLRPHLSSEQSFLLGHHVHHHRPHLTQTLSTTANSKYGCF